MRLERPIPAPVLALIRAAFADQEATPLDAPVVQPLGLFLDLAGEALRERLFIVQSPGGEEACLRPDFTIAAVRAHIASAASTGRYAYEGHAFRVAPKGAERAEEFLQIGLEAFEPDDKAQADAAMAALAWRASAAGGRDDLTLWLGDVALFDALIESLGLAPVLAGRLKRVFASPRRLKAQLNAALAGEEAAPRGGDRLASRLAGLTEAEATGVLEDIWALAGIAPVGGRSAQEIVHRLVERQAVAAAPRLTPAQHDVITRYLAIAGAPAVALAQIGELSGATGPLADTLADWHRRLQALLDQGVPANRLHLATAFGRGFSFYDGVFFEIRSSALGDEAPVAAGGRYDTLPGRMGAVDAASAVGCMVRPGRAWSGGAA